MNEFMFNVMTQLGALNEDYKSLLTHPKNLSQLETLASPGITQAFLNEEGFRLNGKALEAVKGSERDNDFRCSILLGLHYKELTKSGEIPLREGEALKAFHYFKAAALCTSFSHGAPCELFLPYLLINYGLEHSILGMLEIMKSKSLEYLNTDERTFQMIIWFSDALQRFHVFNQIDFWFPPSQAADLLPKSIENPVYGLLLLTRLRISPQARGIASGFLNDASLFSLYITASRFKWLIREMVYKEMFGTMEASFEKTMPAPVFIGRTHGEAIIDNHFLFLHWRKILSVYTNDSTDHLIFDKDFVPLSKQDHYKSHIKQKLGEIGAFLIAPGCDQETKASRHQLLLTSKKLVDRLILQSPIPVEKTCCFEWGLRIHLRDYEGNSLSWKNFFLRFNKLSMEEKNTHGVLLTELWHHFHRMGNQRLETYIRYILYCTHVTSGIHVDSIPLSSFFSIYKVHFKISKRGPLSPWNYAESLAGKVSRSPANLYITSFYNRTKVQRHFKEVSEAAETIPF